MTQRVISYKDVPLARNIERSIFYVINYTIICKDIIEMVNQTIGQSYAFICTFLNFFVFELPTGFDVKRWRFIVMFRLFHVPKARSCAHSAFEIQTRMHLCTAHVMKKPNSISKKKN